MSISQTDQSWQDKSPSGNSYEDTTAFTVPVGTTLAVFAVTAKQNSQADASLSLSWDQTGTPQTPTEQVNAYSNSTNRGENAQIFTLANPTAGNKTLRVTKTLAIAVEITVTAYYITGEAASPIGTNAKRENNSLDTQMHTAITTTQDNSFIIGAHVGYGAGTTPPTLTVYDSSINDHTSSFGDDYSCAAGKCHKTTTSTGSYNLGYTSNVATRDADAILEIKEATTPSRVPDLMQFMNAMQ